MIVSLVYVSLRIYRPVITEMKAVFVIAILTCCSRRYILVNSIVSSTSSNVGASSSLEQVVIPYLQSEMAACSNAQQSILKFLHEKLIPIGMAPGSLRSAQSSHRDDISSRITISSADNNIECRISLGRAPLGSKCVAPCGCTGSQKWVQFSELNKLRRKDPQQWTSCPTCQQKFDYSVFAVYGGLPASLVGYALDHPVILRSTIVSSLVVIGYFGSVKAWIYRFLVSRSLWQQVLSSVDTYLLLMYFTDTNHYCDAVPTMV